MDIIAPITHFRVPTLKYSYVYISRQPNDKWRQSARSYNPEIVTTWPRQLVYAESSVIDSILITEREFGSLSLKFNTRIKQATHDRARTIYRIPRTPVIYFEAIRGGGIGYVKSRVRSGGTGRGG